MRLNDVGIYLSNDEYKSFRSLMSYFDYYGDCEDFINHSKFKDDETYKTLKKILFFFWRQKQKNLKIF